MLTCKQCEAEKPPSDFYESNRATCKECVKANVRANRRKRIEYYRAYDIERGNRQSKKYRRHVIESAPNAYRARYAVTNAVRDGRLEKADACEECGASGHIHGHHDDYSKPLEVRWLCPPCHFAWHRENGHGANKF